MDKLKKWLELAQQYQVEGFWNQIFDESRENSSTVSKTNPFNLSQDYFPKCDLYETDGELVIEIEIPGLTKDDVHFSLNDQILTITGEFKSLQLQCTYFLKERTNRKFIKELTLPYPVLLDQSNSELANGILAIRLPFQREAMERIPISFHEESHE